jgi:hypothetical protein
VLDERNLELALDSARRRKPDIHAWLRNRMTRFAPFGVPGLWRLRKLLALDKSKSDSTAEDIAARLFRKAGLPRPAQNLPISEGGRFLGVFDFVWAAQRVVVQTHGYHTHGERQRWQIDLTQLTALNALGWRTLAFSHDDLTLRPALVVSEVRRALAGYAPNLEPGGWVLDHAA